MLAYKEKIVFKYGIYTGCREIQFTHLPAAPEKLKYAMYSTIPLLLSAAFISYAAGTAEYV